MTTGIYTIQGKGQFRATKQNFIASGGQGDVFLSGKTAYKIYHNTSDMIPLGKISELKVLQEPFIIKPEDVILNNKNVPIGYTMKGLKDSYALCQMFPKAFRIRKNLTPALTLELVRKLQSGVKYTHRNGILIVDLNEMNFAIDDSFKEVYFLDVDSYQTKNYPATALMESIRDRHSKTFNAGTDWFAFAIVSFQMFIGMHPYKGQYDAFNSIPKDKRFDERMLKNISVFHQGVDLPAAILPFNVMPDVYKQWYEAVFEKGTRIAPPDDLHAVLIISPTMQVKRQVGSNNFIIEELFELDGQIISLSGDYITTDKGIYKNQREITTQYNSSKIGFIPAMNEAITGFIENGKLNLVQLRTLQKIDNDLEGDDLMVYGKRFYLKNYDKIYELSFKQVGTNMIVFPKCVASVMPMASKVFEGVIIDNTLGRYNAIIFPESEESYQFQLPELDNQTIIEAKFLRNVLVIVSSEKGVYNKYVLRFAQDFKSYDLRKIGDISYSGINFTVLDNGVCLLLNEVDELELFSSHKDSTQMKVISDAAITGDVKLFSRGAQPFFAKGNKLYKFNMRNK